MFGKFDFATPKLSRDVLCHYWHHMTVIPWNIQKKNVNNHHHGHGLWSLSLIIIIIINYHFPLRLFILNILLRWFIFLGFEVDCTLQIFPFFSLEMLASFEHAYGWHRICRLYYIWLACRMKVFHFFFGFKLTLGSWCELWDRIELMAEQWDDASFWAARKNHVSASFRSAKIKSPNCLN